MYLKIKKINKKILNNALFFFDKKYIEKLKEKSTFKESLVARYLIKKSPNYEKDIFTSILHKKDLVFIWVSEEKLWVDIEIIKQRDISLLNSFLDIEYELLWWKNWFYFLITGLLFAVCVLLFPFITFSYRAITIMAFILWLFFWASSNLIDAYFFNKIWVENKKEYGSSTYWLVLSAIIFVMMFLSSFIADIYWYNILMYFLWSVLLVSILSVYRLKGDL